MTAASPATTRDAFLNGRLLLDQPASGHRMGTDALLLAALARGCVASLKRDAVQVADFGSGAGLVGLALALLEPRCAVSLIERDPDVAALAEINRLRLAPEVAARAKVLHADLLGLGKAGDSEVQRASLDLVVMNPPFLAEGRSRLSPEPYRRVAHALPEGGLEGWLKAARRLLRPGGQIALIHRADALPEILAGLATGFGAIAVLPVHPRREADATRLLVRAVAQSKAPACVRPALVLHDEGGAFTSDAAALHEGRMVL